jgi:hypothetical protein
MKARCAIVLFLAGLYCLGTDAQSSWGTLNANTAGKYYTTSFPSAPENPISEGGTWVQLDTLVNPAVKTLTSPIRAVGANTSSNTDSYAHLTGWGPNYTVTGVVYKDPAINGDGNGDHEVEIHLRTVDTSSTVRLYECTYAFNGQYQQIVVWLPNVTFQVLVGATPLVSFAQGNGGQNGPKTGDTLSATINGNTISTYWNGNLLNSQDITATAGGGSGGLPAGPPAAIWLDGQPGMGIWIGNGNTNATGFGFSSYTVTQLP